jgi:hypothetical protein
MNKVLIVIVVVLIFIVTAQNSAYLKADLKADTVTLHDTAWIIHDSLIIKKLKIKEVIHDTLPPEYIADTNYPKLKAQYEALVSAFLVKNIYTDTLKLDTLGYVAVDDTVYKNEIHNRSYKYNYKIPTITVTTTITKQAPPKGALFIGGGVDGNKAGGVTNVNLGMLFKTKSDKIYGLKVGSNVEGQINYGFQAFWKLKN